jgi:hypothetical protein
MLRAIFGRPIPELRSDSEESILNYCLELAQEWGKNWMSPIQPRLRVAYPSLPDSELDRLDKVARDAMDFAYKLVYDLAEKRGVDFDKSLWSTQISARFPWIDSKNRSHLYSTGMYYVWKDGVGK